MAPNAQQNAPAPSQNGLQHFNEREDFKWIDTDEPHAIRREMILAKYPEIRKLYGYDPDQKWQTLAYIVIQMFIAWYLRDSEWRTMLLVAYGVGGLINHALSLAIHELSHGMMFEGGLANELFGFLCNVPQGIPSFIMFKKYHNEHHLYQGVDPIDVDVPSQWEGKHMKSKFRKLLFVLLQPFTYSVRPMLLQPKPVGIMEVANFVFIILSNALVWHFWGARSVAYMVGSTLIGMSLHPVSGHLIAEHFEYTSGQETYSYYGPLNALVYNVGYHNEHHDFPKVPGSRLPQVRAIASEFYDTMPHYNSWWDVLIKFITRDDVGCFSRIMRKPDTSKLWHYEQQVKKQKAA